MNKEEILLKECVDYFKSTSGFKRTLQNIRKKYESLGTLGGTVVLNNLKEDEKEALTGLFRKDYYKKSTSFKVEAFVKALDNTKFQGIAFDKVLEEYFGEKLLSKKEEKLIYDTEKQLYFHDIIENFKETRAEQWLLYLLKSKENAYRIISQKYDEDKELLKENLIYVCNAYNNLTFQENSTMRLALFSSIITKNPHSFDSNTDCGNLLVYAICYSLKVKYPENAEELSEILYTAGIIKDEVSNYTLCSGILAYSSEKEHIGWRGFYEAEEPLQISLWNISKLNRVISPAGKVYVFENPTVFSEVLYRIGNIKPSLICTFGNFKLASLILIDKLVHSGAKIYYSGDFDPEGIVMADRLKQRYGENVVLWRYTEEDYMSIKSSVQLEEYRIKKMNNIKSEEFAHIADVIRINKCAAYQELLIDKYVEDIIATAPLG
ncbi:TIGR02679 family protein [Clostridium sp. DJ247]|uniref:TIGR02679 family protein n=1 Tax=Clostridium sp. DJ247 TaxID=2726188 RepID=UPI00162A66A7|nr:TIGR02679 family protein [Clostridium sp. DJ247]MBC2580036.1 TIGR02679 family protein [Clostridium sp. DJ247]